MGMPLTFGRGGEKVVAYAENLTVATPPEESGLVNAARAPGRVRHDAFAVGLVPHERDFIPDKASKKFEILPSKGEMFGGKPENTVCRVCTEPIEVNGGAL
jgi:hypothetical protein